MCSKQLTVSAKLSTCCHRDMGVKSVYTSFLAGPVSSSSKSKNFTSLKRIVDCSRFIGFNAPSRDECFLRYTFRGNFSVAIKQVERTSSLCTPYPDINAEHAPVFKRCGVNIDNGVILSVSPRCAKNIQYLLRRLCPVEDDAQRG